MAKRITDEQMNVNISVNGGNEAKKKLGDLEQNYRGLKNEQEDLRKAKQRLIAEGKKETAEYKQIQNALKKNKVQMDQNKDSQKQMREEIGLTGLTMGQLVKEQRRLTSQIKNGTTKGTADYNRLKKELQQVNTVIDEQRKDLRATEDAMGDTAEAGSQLATAFSDVFQGLQSGNMEQVGSGLQVIKNNLQGATRAAWAFIATPIGAAIAVLAGIGIATKQWLDYNIQASEANRLTQQLTQLSGDALDDARIRAEAIQKTFGTDFKDNLKVARNLVTAFGISYEEAFDKIENGLIRGGKENEEFLDSLNEYPKLFAQAGFTVEEFQRIVNSGIDEGIYSDKLPDAIKEFSLSVMEETKASRDALENAFGKQFTDQLFKNIQNGSITTKEALQLVSGEAEAIGLNAQQAQQLTADLFRGAGEDAGGALVIFEAVNNALNEEERQLTALEEQLKLVADANRELGKAKDEALKSDSFAKLSNDVSLFWTKIKTAFYDGIAFIVDSWDSLQQFQTRTFTQITAVVAAFPVVVTRAMIVVKNEVFDVIKTFGNLGTVMNRLVKFDFSGAKEAAADFKNSFVNEAEDVGNVAGKIVESLSRISSEAGKMVDKNFEKSRQGAGEVLRNPDEEPIDPINNPNGNNKNTSTDEEAKKRAEREKEIREKVAEQLKEWERERYMAKEELELVRKEEEFEKLIEDAKGERELIAGLEEEKELQLQEIRDRYAKERLEKEAQEKEKLRRLDEEFAAASAQATMDLERAKARAMQYGLGTLKSFFDEKSGIYKALFLLEKGAAVASVMNNSSKALAEITANTAAANAKAVSASPLTAGMPWVAINTATGTKQALAVKLNAALQIASIAGSAIQGVSGYEDGLYPEHLNVTRTDGKKYRARFGGDAGTRLVNEPTYFTNNSGYIAGEGHKTEMVIDNGTFRRLDPQVVDHIMDVHHRVKGYEDGMYPNGSQSLQAADPEMKAMMAAMMNYLQNPPRPVLNWGYDEAKKNKDLQQEIDQSYNNGKITS